MKNRWFIAVLPLLVFALSGWFWNDKKEDPTIIGIWKSESATQNLKLVFEIDGSFTVAVSNNTQPQLIGEYRIVADKVIFDADQSVTDAACRERAYYYFAQSTEKLRLTLVADSCASRRNLLAGNWDLVSSPFENKKKSKKKMQVEGK